MARLQKKNQARSAAQTETNCHMTSDIGLFKDPILLWKYNQTSSIWLTSVLYVPCLRHSLVSCNMSNSKGYVMKAAGDNILVSMGTSGIPILLAKFIGNIPFVMQTTEHHSLITSTMLNPHTSRQQSFRKAFEPSRQQSFKKASEPSRQQSFRKASNRITDQASTRLIDH